MMVGLRINHARLDHRPRRHLGSRASPATSAKVRVHSLAETEGSSRTFMAVHAMAFWGNVDRHQRDQLLDLASQRTGPVDVLGVVREADNAAKNAVVQDRHMQERDCSTAMEQPGLRNHLLTGGSGVVGQVRRGLHPSQVGRQLGGRYRRWLHECGADGSSKKSAQAAQLLTVTLPLAPPQRDGMASRVLPQHLGHAGLQPAEACSSRGEVAAQAMRVAPDLGEGPPFSLSRAVAGAWNGRLRRRGCPGRERI